MYISFIIKKQMSKGWIWILFQLVHRAGSAAIWRGWGHSYKKIYTIQSSELQTNIKENFQIWRLVERTAPWEEQSVK